MKARTRFAPSPTGFMHIGNLRTALYEYLIAKSLNGDFILRIEDTDRSRFVEGAEEVIYNTLKSVGLNHDEGPDIGGQFAPYRQSERIDLYKKYAEQLVKAGKAYHCFCEKDESPKSEDTFAGYNRKCRDLPQSEIEKFLSEKKPFVIRQRMPESGSTTFKDMVFGEVTIDNKELEDQILLKSDGYPTYNFANVVDDYEMQITHVVRGCEYISSTPKYNLLYEAFGWEIPNYIHLPLIMGQNEDGSTSKLSKRHGAISFEDLVQDGYLPEAIINYIAFLGWCPESNRELFTLDELVAEFSINRISKSPAVFDYKKLDWFNAEYLKAMTAEEFAHLASPFIDKALEATNLDFKKIAALLQTRISKLTEIPEMVDFLGMLPNYDINLFENKKSKTTAQIALQVLKKAREYLGKANNWDYNYLHDELISMANNMGAKNGTVMWPIRIAISGRAMTSGGAIEILDILGKEESLKRIEAGIEKLEAVIND